MNGPAGSHVYLGPGVYRALVLDYGWTHEAWLAWVARAIEEQLFLPGQAEPPFHDGRL